MSLRTSVLAVIVLSLTIAANAQERESQPQPQAVPSGSPAGATTSAGTEAPDAADAPVTPEKKPDRVFGVLPNYGTVEDATTVSAITTKATFQMAALNSFDPYVFPFVGVIAAVAQLENQEKSLGRGPRTYVERYATSLADSTISSCRV